MDLLSVVLGGALGRSGRKRARRAAHFLGGRGGFLSASTLIAAAGVAWGIYDSVKGQQQGAFGASGAMGSVPGPPVPPVPVLPEPLPDPVLRIIRLAVSAARADGDLSEKERALILERAREAGLEAVIEAELAAPHPLADIVRGLTHAEGRKELYVLAFTIVRADETVSGAERIYLAQLAHQLGLDAATVAALESETATKIDAQPNS
ncbi:MAG: DUF533 domain-containing protein [Acidobacteriota bacterium]|nr:DUF533 domain-containing protein [Acidobacteriota bacterium]